MPKAPRSRGSHWRAALLLVALVALQGHVTVTPGEVRASASQTFTVRVPSERPEPTVKVRLEFPAGLGAPRFLAKPGWSYELEKDASGTVTAVTWSGGEIGPDEFDEFIFTARTPAQPGPLTFRAEQTYRSGETVAWAGPPGDSRPAATVEVRDSTFGLQPMAAAGPASPATIETDTGGGGGWMSKLALGLSALAVVLASIGLSRRT
jgi:uncharacterized protein YcnI